MGKNRPRKRYKSKKLNITIILQIAKLIAICNFFV